MPPTSDGECLSASKEVAIRTVGCSLVKLVPSAEHLERLRVAVATTHKATILATELLNMHLRHCITENPFADLSCFFNSNWLLNAYNEVTRGKGKVKVIDELRATRDACMPPFEPPDRAGITQCLLYDARNLATIAASNIWMHFRDRVYSHVKRHFALSEEAYAALTKDARRARQLALKQVAADMCRLPSDARLAKSEYHHWVDNERSRLRITEALNTQREYNFTMHLKKRPHLFLYAMFVMSAEREARGQKAFALYPLRRTYVPRHVRFDNTALRQVFGLGESEYKRARNKEKRQAQKRAREEEGPGGGKRTEDEDDLGLPPLRPDLGPAAGETTVTLPDVSPELATTTQRAARRTKSQMEDENRELFGQILDLRAAGVHRRQRFDYAFTTDGVCARVQMRSTSPQQDALPTQLPRRGIWAIDELKRVSRVEEMHVVGVDPGKRELIVGVSMENPQVTAVRYTQKQRLRDVRSRQYADEAVRDKPTRVLEAERGLIGYNSRSPDLSVFCAYCTKRHETLDECLLFYSHPDHRHRRWKTAIKTQQSEERLYKQLEALQHDERPVVLAYGSWGMVAGRAGAACNRGNPPCIGVGLMRKLAKRFVVAPTPEAYTSKTCCRCLGSCGPWTEVEEKQGKTIRGLRRCTQRDCRIPLNRDRNGATNIGTNFERLMREEPPIRSMTEEDLAFHRASLCLACE
jgi:hypothetical protein